jgi:capsular exopolysaccharide synthesis family protein
VDEQGDLGRQIKKLTFILNKRKWWVILTLLVVVAATILYTKRQKPVYRATASVIIDTTPPRVLSGVKDVVELGSTNYWAMHEYLQTQYKIITGLEVCERVVAKLHLDEDLAFLGVPPDQTITDEERAERIAAKVPARILQGRLTLEPVRDSMMALVSADDPDPARAADVANEVAFAYRAQNIDYRRAATQEANAELRDMVEKYRERKEKADQDLLEYEKGHAIGSFAVRKQAIEDRVKLMSERQGQLLLKRSDLEARIARVKRIEAAGDVFSVPLDTVLGNALISGLKSKYIELRDQRTSLATHYGERFDKVKALDEQMAAILDAIKAEVRVHLAAIRGDYDEVVGALKQIDARLAEANRDLSELAAMQVEYNMLAERKKDGYQVYDQVRSRFMEINLSAQVETNNVRIHEMAQVPARPLKPDLRLNLALGGFLGLLLGLGLAFLVEQLDNTVKGREDVERFTGVPCLGMIPSIPGQRQRRRRSKDATLRQRDFYVMENPKSQASEAMNTIRTNLMFIAPERRVRTILVTSGSPWEGKSTVVIALGITMARFGSRTLLVDTDMRRPRLHRTFGLEAERGLSTLLLGGERIEDVVAHTDVPNLDLLPCGPVPPNPSDLLRMEKLGKLLVELQQRYDTVILDSPPVIPVADPRILSGMADVVVLVVKLGHTTTEGLRTVRRELGAVGAPLVGTILNDLDVRRGGYGYGYAYGYGYGYYGTKHGYYGYPSIEDEKKPADTTKAGGI